MESNNLALDRLDTAFALLFCPFSKKCVYAIREVKDFLKVDLKIKDMIQKNRLEFVNTKGA